MANVKRGEVAMWEVFDPFDGRAVVTYRRQVWAKVAARMISYRTGRFHDYEKVGEGW